MQVNGDAPSSRPASGKPGDSKSDNPKKKSRPFADRVTTTSGILTIIATLITIGGSVALAINRITNGHSQVITVGQAESSLLASSDLAIVDPNIKSSNIEFPGSGETCTTMKPLTVNHSIETQKLFIDKSSSATGLFLLEVIQVYASSSDAQTAFGETAKVITCTFLMTKYPPSNISSGVSDLCAETSAWEKTDPYNIADFSEYKAIVRCGRVIATITFATPTGSSLDNETDFHLCMEIAVPKIQQLT